MTTNYTIKNFRVFDNEGVSLDIKPITILTGCNSSGKSSIVKSLLLLCDYFSQLKSAKKNKQDLSLSSYKFDFTKKPHNSLGKFSKVVNSYSNDKNVTLAIQVHSDILAQNMTVEMTFASDENDDNTNGYITSIKIKNEQDIVVYSSSNEKHVSGNLFVLFPEFLRFVYMQHFISGYQSAYNNYQFIGKPSKEECDNLYELLKVELAEYKQQYGASSLIDINRWNNNNRRNGSFLANNIKEGNIFEEMRDNGIICYLPILSKLDGSKEETIKFINQFIAKSEDKGLKSVLTKIIIDFEESECNDFKQYYKNKEENYYSDFSMTVFPALGKYPKLFQASRLILYSQEICVSPYCTGTNISLDDSHKTTEEERQIEKELEIQKWESRPLSFEMLFEAMAWMNESYFPERHEYHNGFDGIYSGYSSKTERLFFEFIEMAIENIVIDATPEALLYVSSSIINIQRLYPLESSDEFTQLIKDYLQAKIELSQEMDYIPNTFMNKWVKKFGIGERISIKIDDEGLGATIRLHKTAEDAGMLLADNGYGITQLFAILLHIEVAIMRRITTKKIADNNISPVTYDEDRKKIYSSPTIAIEEPEIHLHPRYQSMLAEMFVDAYKNYGIHFIIETHSEYLVRKNQVMVAEKLISPNDIVVAYAFSDIMEQEKGQTSCVKQIEIESDGSLSDNFGSGFYDEATNSFQRLMDI